RVLVAETLVKRKRMARDILFSTLLPEMLIAFATILIVWFGVKRGLGPLARLSEEIKARSPGDLRPIDAAGTPEETRPLVSALNGLLEEVSQASRNQQRFLANAAHQLRTPLAGLQAHTELTLAKALPAEVRAELEQVHQATMRTARLANQLLALARAEPGARGLERFYRVPGTSGTGSGLGLAIVREIAAGHGATIAITEGAAAKGCRVAITFPHG